MEPFLFRILTSVRFGIGLSEELGRMLKEMGYERAFIATDKGIVNAGIISKIEEGLKRGGMEYVIYDELIPDPTIEIIDETAEVLRCSGADVVLAVGGGSPIDTAKSICMLQSNEGSIREYLFGGSKTVTQPSMPLVAVPTTAGTGSEMTPFAVITNNQEKSKVSVLHDYLIPKLTVIDPMLQIGMPPFITATTGMDALTHAIETYVSNNASPISDALAIHAIKMISQNIRKAVENGEQIEARSNMAVASTIAGAAFMNGGLGIVHGISQTIGAIAHVAHGTANALLLPYCMKKNVMGNPEKFKDIAEAMGEKTNGLSLREAAELSVNAVFKLAEDLNVPMKLKEVGVTRDMFDNIIEGTMVYRQLAFNPVRIKEQDVLDVLEDAFE